MEVQRAVRSEAEHPVGDAAVQVGVGVERGAEPLHETDGAEAGRARRVVVQGVVDGNLYACGRIDMDYAPAVPRTGSAGSLAGGAAKDLTDTEVGELLCSS